MFKHSRSARIRQHKPGISPAGTFGSDRAPQMKFLRFVLAAVFALFATVFGVAYFKTSTWTAEGALVLETSPEKVLPFIASPRHWVEWNPWSDPTENGFEVQYSGAESGPGAKMTWDTGHSGDPGSKGAQRHGELTILSASAAEGITYELAMDDVPGKGEIKLEPYGVQTRVRWRYSGDLGGNLFARYFIPFMQKALVPTLQKGLTRLRERVTKDG